MKQAMVWMAVAEILLAARLAINGGTMHAQTGGSFDLTWNTIDGGGGTSSGGAYTLSGTTGQPNAGKMSGGTYSLTGGVWVDTGTAPHAARCKCFRGNHSEIQLLVR